MDLEHFNLHKKLHTDVLEEKYGTIHSEVLRHDDVREVHMLDKENVSRTYALSFLVFDRSNSEIVSIDEEIRNGGLIGKTFREHGFEVRKNVVAVFIAELPKSLQDKMHTKETQAKVRLSEFYARKEGGEPLIYAIVSEIYSPDFRSAEVNEVDKMQDNALTEALQQAGISKEEIWDSLGEGKDFSDFRGKLEQAKELAKEKEEVLVQKVKDYLQQ